MSHLHCKVSALIDGELTGAARKRALAHVRSCSACRDEVAQTLSLKHRLSQMASVEPPGDLQSLLAGAETITCTPRADHLGQRALMLGRTLVVVGSVSVIVLTIAYVVGGPQRAPATKVSPPVDEFTADFASSVGRDPLFYPAVGTMTDDLQPTAYTSGPAAEPTAPAYPRPQSKPRGSLAMSGIQPPAGDEQSAVKLLRRAARAPERLAFQVTRRVKTRAAHGPNAVAVRIRHVPGQGTTYGVTGSGSAHSVPRFVPESKSHGARRSDAAVQRLVHSYDVGVAGPAVVDGRRATMVSASQAGQSVAKFWIDNETGLVLRRETYDAGRPVRSSHLVKLHVSRHGFLAHLPPALETPQAAALSMRVAPVLNDKGWVCPESLSGDFGLASLRQVDVGRDVVHATYSDGLSTLSVFEQKGRLDTSSLHGFTTQTFGGSRVYVRQGLPTVAVWQSGGTIYTVVTDATPDTFSTLVSALPHGGHPGEGGAPGIGARLGSGLHQIVTAVAP